MSERMIWIVRLIGIVMFLVLIYLLMSLHARLVQMNQESGAKPATTTSMQVGPSAFGPRPSAG